MARMRHVFPTSEVPHKWAHQTQTGARNAQGNLYFEGDTIYSYRASWPLARIFRRKGKAAPLVLTNSARYSTTTAQHQYAVERAARHLAQIPVPNCDLRGGGNARQFHAQNLRYLTQTAARLLAAAHRAMLARNVEWRRENAERLFGHWREYQAFFGIRRKAPEFPAEAWAAALARAQRIESPDPVRDAKKFNARERRQAAARAALQAEFDAYGAQLAEFHAAVAAARAHQKLPDAAQFWRDTGRWPAAPEVSARPPYLGYKRERIFRRAGFDLPRYVSDDGRPDTVLLRVNADQIETSQGARIPVAHAGRLWRAIEAVRASGTPYVHNGHSIHAGDYRIDRIDVDGTLRAGCHVIPYSELRMLAEKLNLPALETQP